MPEYSNSQMRQIIDEYIHHPRYRLVLRLRFCESLTYEEIGEEVGYSTQHVKDICRRHKHTLISHL